MNVDQHVLVDDLTFRLEKAVAELRALRALHAGLEHHEIRLNGKIDGVNLALSYLREYK